MYFVGEINIANKGKDVIYDAIKSIFLPGKTFEFNQIYLSQKIDIFGFKKNTLVMLVEDAAGELSLLNQEIKTALNQANEQYVHEHNVPLYNLKKGEEFSYNPLIRI